MGYATGQLSDGFHLLSLAELFFDFTLFGNILRHGNHTRDCSVLVSERQPPHMIVKPFARAELRKMRHFQSLPVLLHPPIKFLVGSDILVPGQGEFSRQFQELLGGKAG